MRLIEIEKGIWINLDHIIRVDKIFDNRTDIVMSNRDVISADLSLPEVIAKLIDKEASGLKVGT